MQYPYFNEISPIRQPAPGGETRTCTPDGGDFLQDIVAILTDMAVIFFDLLMYSMLFPLKTHGWLSRVWMWGGCGAILFFYFVGVYVWRIPASFAAAVFMTIPSFLLFLVLSRHKGSRFLLTFCFVDTVSLIVAFLGRYVGILFHGGSLWALLVVITLFSILLAVGHKRFRAYHVLLNTVDSGWGFMAFCTVLIYFALIFFAAYPEPMIQRPEYAPCWLIFAAVVLACYGVFLQSIHKTLQIQKQNARLEREKHLFQLIYTDALTGLSNRAAYVEQMNTLERARGAQTICCVMLDCNHFKQINDQFGHHGGDQALRCAADALRAVFSTTTAYLFRIGGDEFSVILPDCPPERVDALLAQLTAELTHTSAELGMPISMAAGYALTQPGENIEDAFIRADRNMYQNKAAFHGRATS